MVTRDGKNRSGTWRPEDEETSWERERHVDRGLMDLARKLVRGGAEVVVNTQDVIRERAGDIKSKEIPRELVESVAHLTARTKDELVGLLAREFKNYLEKLDLVEEARSIIEQYSLDVNMTIRLRPNEAFGSKDKAASAGGDEKVEEGGGTREKKQEDREG